MNTLINVSCVSCTTLGDSAFLNKDVVFGERKDQYERKIIVRVYAKIGP